MDGLAILVVFFALCSPLVLYLLIAAETSEPRVVDRETAIQEAKATGGRGSPSATPADDERDATDERMTTAERDATDGRESDDGVEFGWVDDPSEESDEWDGAGERDRR